MSIDLLFILAQSLATSSGFSIDEGIMAVLWKLKPSGRCLLRISTTTLDDGFPKYVCVLMSVIYTNFYVVNIF